MKESMDCDLCSKLDVILFYNNLYQLNRISLSH